MKKFIYLLTIILLCSGTTAMAQQDKEVLKAEKKAKRAAKKAAKSAEKQALYEKAVKALYDRKFLYKIDRVQLGNGRFHHVDNRGSFFELNDTTSASQIDGGSVMYTPRVVYGTISDFKLSTDKKGNVSVEFTLREKTSIYPKNIKIRLESGYNEAAMTIAEKKGMRIYLRGSLVPLGSTNMFRGTPVIF